MAWLLCHFLTFAHYSCYLVLRTIETVGQHRQHTLSPVVFYHATTSALSIDLLRVVLCLLSILWRIRAVLHKYVLAVHFSCHYEVDNTVLVVYHGYIIR